MVKKVGGFTLIELMVTMAIGAIVLAIVIITANPGQQLARARNSERTAHLNVIANAVRRNYADNRNAFSCAAGQVPTSSRRMAVGTGSYDIASCLIPVYLFTLPHDPSLPSAYFSSTASYDTGYDILRNATTGEITLTAPGTEANVPVISITR
jgi:prepilin-type N-terminal cleavage/methylation domain-containing protein